MLQFRWNTSAYLSGHRENKVLEMGSIIKNFFVTLLTTVGG